MDFKHGFRNVIFCHVHRPQVVSHVDTSQLFAIILGITLQTKCQKQFRFGIKNFNAMDQNNPRKMKRRKNRT